MSVSNTNVTYDKAMDKWELTRSAAAGVSLKDSQKFITRRTHEDENQYVIRLEKAIYTNYTGRTLSGLKGAIFRLEPRVELPEDLDFMLENADGAGQSIVQVAKYATDEVMLTGRFGMLADYPSVEEGLTAEQINRMGLQPHIATYT